MVRLLSFVLFALALFNSQAQSLRIVSIQRDGRVSWQNELGSSPLLLETSSNLLGGWRQIADLPNSGQVSNSTVLPPFADSMAFYRLRIPPTRDPSLLLHLSFDQDFSNGLVFDESGNGNHGRRYDVNYWPKPVASLNGSGAGLFESYPGDAQFPLGRGDYVSITSVPQLDKLTNGTVMIWAHYQTNSYHNASLFDAGYYTVPGSWSIGRFSRMQTALLLTRNDRSQIKEFMFPDFVGTNGDTGDWHHYGFTFDGQTIRGYFDGKEFANVPQAPYPELTSAGPFIAIACRHHLGTPEWGDDPYPNNGWLVGKIDDARIYSRALSKEEVQRIYMAFDTRVPGPPDLIVRAAASSIVELSWRTVYDKFGVDAYVIERDGEPILESKSTTALDATARPGANHTYRLRVRDISGNVSLPGAAMTVAMPPKGANVDLILDDALGSPWVVTSGQWDVGATLKPFYGAGYSFYTGVLRGQESFSFVGVIPETGDYEVSIRYMAHTSFETVVPVQLTNGEPLKMITLNQRFQGAQWISIGRFSFAEGSKPTIRIGTDGTTKAITVDAVRFSK